jgi:riboflavin kinase/FMN adenylyltransferase
MKIYRGLSDKSLKPARRAVAVGIFDGVHKGHRRILSRAIGEARRIGGRAMAVTFDPHPNKILRCEADPPIILSLEHRLRLFVSMGLDEALVIRFDKRFSGMTHETFLEKALIGKLGMRSLSVGYDFRFGKKGAGDAAYLRRAAAETGFALSVADALKDRGEIVSSTRIRRLIESGDLKLASRMLGRPVSVYGTVVRGRGRGKKVGFPTANLNPHHETLPPSGVYAAWGYLGGRRLQGVIHIGQRPTFGDRQKSLEVHFLDFHKDIYGREVELIFVSKLRDTKKFDNPAELGKAIASDIRRSERVLARKTVLI